ncbi:hypothetical protein HY285_04445 [Candidatus Peregrinibacteria bacterium]|nr:hypothetical protein [Candidatus Peregrinibacteria bacterium]MBI3816763.1 hypothetical protein [Candidatus Peregrinibacteria bacterium]
MIAQSTDGAALDFIPATSQREWETRVREEVGEKEFLRIKAEQDVTKRKAMLNEAFRKSLKQRKPELNGKLEEAAKDRTDKFMLNQEQLEAKEGWVKSALLAPLRFMKWLGKKTIVEHPIVTALTVSGLLWYTGFGAKIFALIQSWIASLPDGSAVKSVVEKFFPLKSAPGTLSPLTVPGGGVINAGAPGMPPLPGPPLQGGPG